jgi:glycyl-tRNA synthetase (class II)
VLLLHDIFFQHILIDDRWPTQLSLDVNDALLFFVSRSIAEDQIHILESLSTWSAIAKTTTSGIQETLEAISTFPRVSGIQKKVNAKANRQNAAKKIYVPQVIPASISGVTRPMMLKITHL